MYFRSMFALIAVVSLLSGCQSTTVRSAWFDTNFSGPPLRKIVVSGFANNIADGRVFEDAFVEKLRATGVEAVAGHAVGLGDTNMSEAAFVTAVVNSGAQGLLLVRLLGVDTRTQVTTTMVNGGMGWGTGPWGTTAWPMMPVQQVSQYELATVETKLFDVKTKQLLWAATTTTFNPRSVARETPGFADLIIGQLAQRNIISVK